MLMDVTCVADVAATKWQQQKTHGNKELLNKKMTFC